MSWMRLLAVGRSIGHIGNQPSRYRMAYGVPKLGNVPLERRAGGLRAETPREQAPASAVGQFSITPHRKVAQAPAKAGRATVMFNLIKKIFFGKDPKMKSEVAGTSSIPASTFDVPPQAYPLGRWTMFRNPFAKRSKPVDPVAPVQGELLLDMVKPVRNDLLESDLEVVSSTPVVTAVPTEVPNKPAAAEPLSMPSREVTPAAWGRVSEEFFGAGKS